MITTANIRATNGVIHVTNKMLGFIYQTALEQIQEDARYNKERQSCLSKKEILG